MSGSTGLRLTLAFLAVLTPFAVGVAATFIAFGNASRAEREIQHLDHCKHAGHIAASQVREQYIHQAHTLIVRNLSHVEDHYERAAHEARMAVQALESQVSDDTDKADAREIVRLAALADSEFRNQVVPSVSRGDIDAALSFHDTLASIADRVVTINEALNRRLEERSMRAQERAKHAQQQARATVAGCFAIASAIAFIVAAATTRSFVRRIGALRDGAELLAQGKLDTRIAINGHDELSRLARAMNAMSASLRDNQQLLLRNQRLASLGQVAAGVAHEINNPIGVILGYAKILQRTAPTAGLDDLRTIESEARQCQRIVSGLLDLAKPRHLELAPTKISTVLAECIDRVGADRRAERVFEMRSDPTIVANADESQLRQVFDNVLANALDATQASGKIAVTTRVDRTTVEVVIADDGVGVDGETERRAFEPFFTTKRGGTGLGLAICQSIIDAHHGTITIEPALPGTRVTITLPMEKSA